MGDAAIQVEAVGKRYRLGSHGSAYLTLRETLAARFAGERETRDTWALRDVSFEVASGEAVGVIGANGAGKSTLLRILSRISQPTTGFSRTRGRVGSLLEVGTGFHQELTGRENVYLNGAILGMRRREITRRFDEIIEFSGVERFLDTPLKRYSSGMYLRLAFAVAAHLEPEILLVDEVLAVGDVQFREKCLGKMTELGREGRTVLFVSHDLGAITRLCHRAIWLAGGRVVEDGPSGTVVESYLRAALPGAAAKTFEPDAGRRATLVAADARGPDGSAPTRGAALTLLVSFRIQERVRGLSVAFILHGPLGVPVLDEDWGADVGDELSIGEIPKDYSARLEVPGLLPAGEYRLEAWIGTPSETLLREEALRFQIAPRADDVEESLRRRRAVQPDVTWTVDELATAPVISVTKRARALTAPSVTVVIPTRNRRQLLSRAALPSALRQTGVDVEVLVIDDGSTDGTAEWIASLADPRVRAIRHDRSRGVAAARNAGIAEATAPWVAFLDDDDHWSPEKLFTLVAHLQSTTSEFAYSGVLVVGLDGEPVDRLSAPPARSLKDELLQQNVIPAGSSNVVASTELLRGLGGFDEELAYLADWDMWIRLELSGRGVACDDALVAYVRHPGQMQLTGRTAIAELGRLRSRHAAAGFAPDGGRLLSWVAGEQRRGGRRAEAVRTYALATTTYRDLRWLKQIIATPFDSGGLGLKNHLRRRARNTSVVTRPDWVPAP